MPALLGTDATPTREGRRVWTASTDAATMAGIKIFRSNRGQYRPSRTSAGVGARVGMKCRQYYVAGVGVYFVRHSLSDSVGQRGVDYTNGGGY